MQRFLLTVLIATAAGAQNAGHLGIFEGAGDVGDPEQKSSASFDAARGEYKVSGSGANMWEKKDQFQFLWKRISGNAAITTEIHFPGQSKAGHRKAVLIFRQGMETGAAYVDAAIHGSGLTAVQFREKSDEITRGVRFPVVGPAWVRLERRGPWYTLFTSADGKKFHEGGSVQVKLTDPLYVGIGVCSHDPKAMETAVFSHVSIEPLAKESK